MVDGLGGKNTEADIVFLDEIFKANDGVLNSPADSTQRAQIPNEGRTYPIPAISFFAASNEILILPIRRANPGAACMTVCRSR